MAEAEVLDTVPNLNVYQKAKSKYKNSELPTTNRLTNLLFLVQSSENENDPYIHQLCIARPFSFILSLERHFDIIKSIEPHNRIAHVDSTGILVKITKAEANMEYPAIMNYFLYLKDLSRQNDKDWKGCLVGEFVTGDQSTNALKHFFAFYFDAFKAQFDDELRFRYLVSDYSWVIIHSALQEINHDSILEYAQAVMQLCIKELDQVEEFMQRRTWLVSCAAHTMHRYSKAIKALTASQELYEFGCFCFNLLLTSTDLTCLQDFFKLICFVFLSKDNSSRTKSSIQKLNDLIN